MSDHIPRVSMGLPVYNGERYIASAIDSMLAQTYTDFELIISDNASTDATERICREYAQRDSRVRYIRQPVNQGASRNYNIVVEESRGVYFKWHSFDDLVEPTFVEKAIKILDSDTSVVLVYCKCKIIGNEGEHLPGEMENAEVHLRVDSLKVAERYGDLACVSHKSHRALEGFGLVRAAALKSTPLYGKYAGADKVVIARLAMLGRFYELPEYLFSYRVHPAQSVRTLPSHVKTSRSRLSKLIGVGMLPPADWFDPASAGKIKFPTWALMREYVDVVRRSPVGPADRLRCYGKAFRRIFSHGNWARMGRDLIIAADMLLDRVLSIFRREPAQNAPDRRVA